MVLLTIRSSIELMTSLLSVFPQLVNGAIDESNGFTALHYAVHYGYAEAITLLVSSGADMMAVNKVNAGFRHKSILVSFYNSLFDF